MYTSRTLHLELRRAEALSKAPERLPSPLNDLPAVQMPRLVFRFSERPACPPNSRHNELGKGRRDAPGARSEETPETISMEIACERLLADCKHRKLATETYGKYDLLCRELKAHFKGMEIKAISADDVARYRETWKLSPVSAGKKLERLKAFFRFSIERGWRRVNPALSLKAPKGRPKPTLPFTDAEIEKIFGRPRSIPYKGSTGSRIAGG